MDSQLCPGLLFPKKTSLCRMFRRGWWGYALDSVRVKHAFLGWPGTYYHMKSGEIVSDFQPGINLYKLLECGPFLG